MKNTKATWNYDMVIVGGLGHVGLPLGLVFADKGLKVCLFDIDEQNAKVVNSGKMPFLEYGAEPVLKRVLKKKTLITSHDISCISEARYVVIAIGTPVDEYLNPKTRSFLEFFDTLKPYLKKEQAIIIRSTVYPNTCKQILARLGTRGKWKISYCPERIIQGYSIKELHQLPQIIAGLSDDAVKDATNLFKKISPKIIKTSMGEAELIKLFANAWRYIRFAIANQFYMISENFGVDYDQVRNSLKEGYERAADIPGAGFAAGPCLLKDTMQLSAFSGNNFLLGHAAMMINEGLPNYIVEGLRTKYNLTKIKIGILGMAFKADIDDIRDSLSFKLGKILRFHGAFVYYSDEFAKNSDFVSKDELIKKSKIVIVAVPHSAYRNLVMPNNTEVVDLWNITKGGISHI